MINIRITIDVDGEEQFDSSFDDLSEAREALQAFEPRERDPLERLSSAARLAAMRERIDELKKQLTARGVDVDAVLAVLPRSR
jgi:site-specific recombinase